MLAALVFRVRRKELQVLRTVVRRVVVPVMHNLSRKQEASQHPLHHQSVLAYVPMVVRLRVIRSQHEPVASLVEEATTAPPGVL
jgi:hypothetical protein